MFYNFYIWICALACLSHVNAYNRDTILKDISIENPNPSHLNTIGTVAKIMRLFKMPDGSSTIIIQGKKRLKLIEQISNDPYLVAKIEEFDESRLKKFLM